MNVYLQITANCMRGKNPCNSVFGLLINGRTIEWIGGSKSQKRYVVDEAKKACAHRGWTLTKVYDQFKGHKVVR